MLLTNKYQRVQSPSGPLFGSAVFSTKPRLAPDSSLTAGWNASPPSSWTAHLPPALPDLNPAPVTHPQEVDPFYLFARHLAWERHQDPTAAWDLIAATHSSHSDTRAHALALLATSRQFGGGGHVGRVCRANKRKQPPTTEGDMSSPYGLEIVDSCADCKVINSGFLCGFSSTVLKSLNDVSLKSVLPAGAILFVEGQTPRGMFIVCAGKVNLSTTSREGKILILKTALAGEALGLSATISGVGYETTAETATPCQLDFVNRHDFLELMQCHSEVGMNTAQCLSRDYHSAYRDIHDLVLTRSSEGKLARLLLSHSPAQGLDDAESRIHASMTHEEMAQRIGSSRETVTRLLGVLKKKRLLRLDGSTLVIRDRSALKALAD